MSKKQKPAPHPTAAPPPVEPTAPVASGLSFFEKKWLPQIALASIAACVWAASISNDFVFFDDDKAILYNHALQNPSLSKFFAGQNLGMYAPISWIAYWVGSLFSGKDPWGYHLLGVALHALNAAMVFSLLRSLTGRAWAAFFAALLFAVHPMQAEAVCWAAALSTVLFSTFYIGSALAWLRWRTERPQNAQSGPAAWLFGSVALFLLACLSKSAAVTLPLILVAMEAYKRFPLSPNFRELRVALLPYLAISLWFGFHTFTTRAQEGHDIAARSATFPPLDRFWMVCQTILFYPFKLLIPFGYSISYPFVKSDGAWSADYYVAPLILALLGYFIWKKLRNQPDLLLAIALYALPLVVMLPFKTVGTFELRSDRYAYLSCIGVFFALAVLLENTKTPLKTVLFAAAGALLAVLAFRQISVWKDGTAMFANCVEKTPESSLCQCNLAYNRLINSDFQAAVDHYSAALRSDPSVVEAYNGRGQALFNLRQIQPAYEDFHLAIQSGLSSPKLFLNRGKCLVMLNRSAEALPDLSKSLELEPKEPEAWYFRGVANEKTDHIDAALSDYARAAELRPGYVESLTNRGVLLLHANRLVEAIADFDKAIQANGKLPMLHSNRANAYLQLGKYPEAVRDASTALSLNNKYLPAYQIRGNAYLKMGDAAKGQSDLSAAAKLQGK